MFHIPRGFAGDFLYSLSDFYVKTLKCIDTVFPRC